MINKIVIIFIGKLYILLSIKEFSENKGFNKIKFVFSKFFNWLKNNNFWLNINKIVMVKKKKRSNKIK